MKKNYSFYSVLIAIPCIAFALIAFSSGQGGAFSGSPGDSNNTCSNCHNGGAQGGTVTLTNVPTTYQANAMYNLQLDIAGGSSVRRGFNITAEDANGVKVGSWTAGAGQQLRNDSNGLTHTTAGNSNTSWTLQWQAPATDVGGITFYYATVQGDGSGSSGDQVVAGNSAVSLGVDNFTQTQFAVYPNPFVDRITVDLTTGGEATYEIYDVLGKRVVAGKMISGEEIGLSDLRSGMYILRLQTPDGEITRQLVKS